ncbi:MAG: AMP-binding protein [Sphingomonadales bacterium]|nr:AMP-binding protein [Sphingomonadales bacterium]MDE2570776.1 AMP-binding protein [Sphingomonadales bacterium]
MKLNFSRVMRALAERFGDAEALVNLERGRRLSYREYHLLTNRIANAIRGELGIGMGDRFMLILENDNLSLMHMPMFLKQEGTAVLTNIRDSLEEHRRQIEFVGLKLVILENCLLETHLAMLRDLGCMVVTVDAATDLPDGVLALPDLIARASDEDNEVALDQTSHTAMMRFTGGTTGKGKCAMYTPDNIMACRDSFFIHTELGWDAQTRALHAAPLSHGAAMLFYPTLFSGGTNVTMNALDLEAWIDAVDREGISHSFMVPTALYRLLELQNARPRDLTSLRTLLYGAAPMNPARLKDLLDCFGPIFVQSYAATEAGMILSMLGKADHRTDSPAATARLASTGRVTPGVEVYIADLEGNELPVGETGEILIRCRAVVQGYYRNPEQTVAEFDSDCWHSGDLGFIDADGYLYLVDRLKDMIISGGFNVYAVEVEAALAEHPAVLMSAVVGRPHPEWGEAVHAEVVLRDGIGVDEQDLINHVKARLGSYKAPKTVSFASALPLSPVGKVLRRVVRDRYWGDGARSIN